MTDAFYANELGLLSKMFARAELFLHILEHAPIFIGLYVNVYKAFMYFKNDEAIFTLSNKPRKLLDQFKYLGIYRKQCQRSHRGGVDCY